VTGLEPIGIIGGSGFYSLLDDPEQRPVVPASDGTRQFERDPQLGPLPELVAGEVRHDSPLHRRRKRNEGAADDAIQYQRAAWRERNAQRVARRCRGERSTDHGDERRMMRGVLATFVERLHDSRRESERREGLRQPFE